MVNVYGIYEVLRYDVINLISSYLNSSSISEDYVDLSPNSESIPLVKPQELVREEIPKRSWNEVLALDGSSRSFVSGKGSISIASLAVASITRGIYGVYPSVDGNGGLPLQEPFIAVASSTAERSRLDPYIYASKYVSFVSLDGRPFSSIRGVEQVETELRALLETKALGFLKGKGAVIVDGPLFPSYLYLSAKVRDKIIEERRKALDQNFIGVVKRIDKSQYLVNTLNGEYRDFFIQRYKVDPKSFVSDEAFLLSLTRFNENTPYSPTVIGPFMSEEKGTPIFVNYLVIPFNPYVPKFSILRVESLVNSEEVIRNLLAIKITREGIPYLLALADAVAKKVSQGLYKLVISGLQKVGLQSSYYSRIEELGT
ncbi:MAG: DNA double-strand break repair nuclease NurA [Candidatus Aramenus sp.]|jgi:hypothetical protein|nr:DNA double-strand break repair nuclease NurA [Candidatus Aramenus sp.]